MAEWEAGNIPDHVEALEEAASAADYLADTLTEKLEQKGAEVAGEMAVARMIAGTLRLRAAAIAEIWRKVPAAARESARAEAGA